MKGQCRAGPCLQEDGGELAPLIVTGSAEWLMPTFRQWYAARGKGRLADGWQRMRAREQGQSH